MRKLSVILGAAMLAATSASGQTPGKGGTIEGTTTTEGGALLNGMCGKLYDRKGTTELIDFAGTGTDGSTGHYIQEHVPAGHYLLLFVNCGANTDGTGPDFHYTPIFFGSTWNVHDAVVVTVTNGVTTTLGPQQVPYGGYVTGTVIDTTINAPADTPPISFVPPGGSKFFLSFSWTLVCGNPDGTYSSNTFFQQGIPAGSKVVFAPGGWGCTDSQGLFNAGKWVPQSRNLAILPGDTIKKNGAIAETGN